MNNNNTITRYSILLLFLLFFSTFTFVQASSLEDGLYSALFSTDSSMFKVNEANEGRGILTVKDGEMTIHVALSTKNILNLFPGLAEDAKKEGAVLLEPSIDPITYSDGFQDEVYGFDIPVPYLDEEFDVALIGKKGKWYDHKVSVSDPVSLEPLEAVIEDGNWHCEAVLKGGSGRAAIESPAEISVTNGEAAAVIVWNSPHYEYMLIDGIRYEPINKSGNSVFSIPVIFDHEMPVSALTVAMSQPHLIDYTLMFNSSSCAAADHE